MARPNDFLIAVKSRYRPARRAAIGLLIALANTYYSGSALAGAFVSMTLQPVPPQTVPPSNYPPGTTIVGQEIILGSVPARVWLELQVTGWAPDVLKVVQGTISATDLEQDGGGYAGTAADCLGQPANGGNLTPALIPCGGTCLNNPSQPCADNSECRTCEGGTRNGLPCEAAVPCPGGICPPSAGHTCLNPYTACRAISGPSCAIQEASKCRYWDGLTPSYFPAGYYCEPGFQNKCHPAWGAQEISYIAATDLTTLNYRYGFACDPGEVPMDYAPSYFGTLVLDVPANAKGTYTIDFKEDETFVSTDAPPGGPLPFPLLRNAKITVPCGRCCSGYTSGQAKCVDHVVIGECLDTADQLFTEGEVCPDSGGPDCAECASDADCDDGIACTLYRCGANHQCSFTPLDVACDDGVFCNGVEVCNVASGCEPGRPPCEYYQCDEEADACHPGIPTVSNWGLAALALVILIAAKLRYRRELASGR